MARGTTGAPRHGQTTDYQDDHDDHDSHDNHDNHDSQDTQDHHDTQESPGALIRFVTGRETKYVVLLCWLVLVAVTGALAGSGSLAGRLPGVGSTLLFATLCAIVVLLLTGRSPFLWLPPILSAGVALAAAEAVIYLLNQHASLTVTGQSAGILVVLVIGASTDYALLLIARYRDELRRHADRHVAMAVALRRAGPAIVASCLTVVAGVLCLLAAEPGDIAGLGPVAAIGIAAGLIVMVTLLPALLVAFGRWPVRTGLGTGEPAGGRAGRSAGRHIWWPRSLSRPAAVAGQGTAAT